MSATCPGFPAGTTSPPITGPRRSRCPPGSGRACRLSRRGNRRLNHAIHMAAITQIRNRHSQGRVYYDKKLTEGKTPKEALRALKRQVSNAIFACLQADARRAAARAKGPGGQQGNDSVASAAGSHPRHRLFGQATPGPGHHTTTVTGGPPPGPARGRDRAGHSSIAATLPPATPQVQVERPQRGRTTWRCGETTATLGCEEGHGSNSAGKETAPEGHLTSRGKDRRNSLTQRGIRYGRGGTSQRLASGPRISITLSRRCLSALTPRRTTAAAHPAPGVRPVLTKPTHGRAESEPWAAGRLAGAVMGGVERHARNVGVRIPASLQRVFSFPRPASGTLGPPVTRPQRRPSPRRPAGRASAVRRRPRLGRPVPPAAEE